MGAVRTNLVPYRSSILLMMSVLVCLMLLMVQTSALPHFNFEDKEEKSAAARLNPKMKHSQTRKRRMTQEQNYEIEIMFVLDYSLYMYWYNLTPGSPAAKKSTTIHTLRQFYAFVLNSINLRYKSVTGGGYTISCLFAGMYIADFAAAAPFTENNIYDEAASPATVIGDDALHSFKAWAESNLQYKFDYDHAMMFTRYDLGSIKHGEFSTTLVGEAFTSGLCTEYRYSINEDHFMADMGAVAAHELGHNLGAEHDGSGNACSYDSGYIMNPATDIHTDLAKNRREWVFSSCSMDYFDKYIDELNSDDNNCMATRSPFFNALVVQEFAGQTAGQVYSPDEQCRRSLGDGSYLYRGYYKGDYSTICALLACEDLGGTQFLYMLPWDGTTCGDGKVCMKGYCVKSESAPSVPDEECMFGDTPGHLPNQQITCQEAVVNSSDSYKCYGPYYNLQCCHTCNIYKRYNADIPGCKFGDRSSHCDKSHCEFYDVKDFTWTCCSTCSEHSKLVLSTTTSIVESTTTHTAVVLQPTSTPEKYINYIDVPTSTTAFEYIKGLLATWTIAGNVADTSSTTTPIGNVRLISSSIGTEGPYNGGDRKEHNAGSSNMTSAVHLTVIAICMALCSYFIHFIV